MRIIITGGRNRNAYEDIERELSRLKDLGLASGIGGSILVHGACPTGADHDAVQASVNHEYFVEPHPADWKKYGRSAGPRRNERMAALGADLCLAFPSAAGSPGTWDMIRRAVNHGIKTIIIPEES
jgi:hypothetical protein